MKTVRIALLPLLLLFLAGCSSPDRLVTKKIPKEFVEFGNTRIDDYYWLSDAKDSAVIQHLKDENAHTEAALKHTEGLQRKIYDEMIARLEQQYESLPVKKNGYWYYVRYKEGQQYPVHFRKMVTREAPEEIHYESAARSVQAWLVKPPRFDASRKYPLLLDIRDSPPAMYGAEFQLRAQIFAARGYVVLCANPRGTPGYGETFGELLRGRHPGDDADDLMRGVEAAVSKGYIDTARMAVEGGVVAAWLIGHTDRFAAAVIERPIVDWTAGVLLSPEGPSRAANWMGGWPWDDPELYLKRSPVFFAANFRTPTLVLAGDGDAQSEELYRALRIRGVKTAMARLGDGPRDRVLALEAALKWMGW